ncbi:hypothetical protein [Rubellimicrobium roseum]|uniref:Uncharacterized protein n=1 Tax=Rubellimicrobium roseum TaxID=687525 RepID=A0A5C4NIU9_9RHOB|nr:hypothetical protein [Rubellimicrobium roseum]TNC73870.1 hypothetical protein FHG71_05220 [Rubellimicrobium roseum]
MEISNPSMLAPRPEVDLRPAADAAASARIIAPPPGLAQGPVVAPASSFQSGWLARSLLGMSAATEAGRAPPEAPASRRGEPQRVLKPWGIPMLPADRPDRTGNIAASGGSVPSCAAGAENGAQDGSSKAHGEVQDLGPDAASSRLST